MISKKGDRLRIQKHSHFHNFYSDHYLNLKFLTVCINEDYSILIL